MKEPEPAAQMAKSAGSIQNTRRVPPVPEIKEPAEKYKTSAITDPWKRSAGCKRHLLVEPGSCRKIEEGESMKNKNAMDGKGDPDRLRGNSYGCIHGSTVRTRA